MTLSCRVPPRPTRLTVPVVPATVIETDPILSPVPQLVVRNTRALRSVTRILVGFTEQILREISLRMLSVPHFGGKERQCTSDGHRGRVENIVEGAPRCINAGRNAR